MNTKKYLVIAMVVVLMLFGVLLALVVVNYFYPIPMVSQIGSKVHDWPVKQVQSNNPIINRISGPTTLNVNQTGTWIINANEPQNGNLSYSVVWGDEVNYSSIKASGPASDKYVKTTIFNHSYLTVGNYIPKFYVTDSVGNTVNSSLSVNVKNNVATTSFKNCTSSATWGCMPISQGIGNNSPSTVCGCIPTCNAGLDLIANGAYGVWPDGSSKGTFDCSVNQVP